jgi:hypothetical protein
MELHHTLYNLVIKDEGYLHIPEKYVDEEIASVQKTFFEYWRCIVLYMNTNVSEEPVASIIRVQSTTPPVPTSQTITV